MEGSVGYREVIPDQTRPEKCKEFTLNTGGTPSTLQDIKVQQRAGGYSYKTYPDRFIYWRTNHDVLELIEQSLSVNLTSNHVKYRFTDTPILEGVSIHETYNSVIVLVAAVSSVHRLVFPHPDKLPVQQQATVESSIPSIFSEASLSAARDPTTYHILTSSPNLPHTGTSCLTSNGDALFALALGTGVILLVHLEPLSGVVTCNELRQDTVMPRFLSGLTDALLGRNAEDSVAVSLVLHCINNVFYLFGVCRDGQLRVWNCDKGHCLEVYDVSDGAALYAQGGRNHSVRKAIGAKGELLLCMFLGFTSGSCLVIVSPSLESGKFQFTRIATILTPENHDLVEVWLGDKGNHRAVWCIWVTNQGETAISYSLISSTNWVWASLQPAPPFERNLNPMIDPKQAYLDAIFEPGVFSVADINRALSIYRRPGNVSSTDIEITSAGDLRQCVCQAVEAEIQVEVSEYELTDDEYLEVADRCWSRFYSCCVQYLQTGTAALGLFWLPATQCIAVVKKTGFSLLRSMDPVEVLTFTDPVISFGDSQNVIVSALKLLEEGEDARFKIEAALTNTGSLDAVIAEVATEIESEKTIRQAVKELEIQLREHLDVLDSIGYLLRMLNMPLPNPAKEGEGEGLNSHLGISTIVSTLDQLVSVRLDMCIKLLLMLELSLGGSLKATWSQKTKGLCQQLWTLKWLCRAQFSSPSRSVINLFSHTPPLLLHKFLLSHEGIAQSSLLNGAAALAYAVWPDRKSNVMAEFLLDTQQYLLLQQFSCLVPHESWNITLAQAFLEMGEPHKAFDLVVGESKQYFKIIQMFERHDLSDLVIDLANNAIQKVKCLGDNTDLPTLHSILFLHHLKLGHWESAYNSLETNPEESRRIDCLGQLVTELVNARQINTLLEFPYHGLLSNLETFLETRARSLDIEQAAIYYNILYSLHINHENYKKAASVMYEHGLRSETCKAQFRCYVASLNALHLVHPDNAWIVKPSSSAKDSIVLLELKDIQREYELSKARCTLNNCSIDTSPREVVAICVLEGLYKTALRLCHLFKLSYDQPLEALSTACVIMTNQDKVWDWLLLNDISDLVVGDESPGTAAWRLLEHLLLKYEERGLTRLHQVIARKIMSHSAFLPHWLEASYKKRNPGELMRLYIRHGNLQQAGMLAIELLKAGLGAGREHFPMEHSLLPTAPPLWLPLNTIDALLAELQHHPSMKSMDEELSMMLDKYIETATRVSNDKIAASVISQREIG